ncbi:MAG: general secretion pathway protein GspK [Nitrospira sp. CG24C]|nr:MAG: general secretion pathway protein GspK [Nitrospira sp. CG24C]TKB54843.1 MAG: general secretion pathway protein GspK [Nitrospira sp.]
MQRSDERGIALLLTLLVLTLLVAMILEFDAEARREYRDAAAFRDNFKATVLARASVQAARGVLQQDFLKDKQAGQPFDALTDLWAFPITNYVIGDGLLNAKIEDERGKLNLNDLAVLSVDANAKKIKVGKFKRLFELVQINPDLVDAIVDWVDQDETPEPSGAESIYYQSLRPSYRAANAPLQTFLELRLIKGMTPEILAKLSKLVAVYDSAGDSKMNMNTADSLVLQALDVRITQGVAGDIIQSRPYKTVLDLDRVSSFAEFGPELRGKGLIDVQSNLFLARMTVKVNEVTRNAVVVLQRDAGTGMSTVQYYRVL